MKEVRVPSAANLKTKLGRRETFSDIVCRVPKQELRLLMTRTQVQAAKIIGISPTTLKKLCRHYGIPRWPFRQIAGVDRVDDRLDAVLQPSTPKTAVTPRDFINDGWDGGKGGAKTARTKSAHLPFRHGRRANSISQRRTVCPTGVARGSRFGDNSDATASSPSTAMPPPAPHLHTSSSGGEKKTVVPADHSSGNRGPGSVGLAIGVDKLDWSSSGAVQAAETATSRADGWVSGYGRCGSDNGAGNKIEDCNPVCSSRGATTADAAAVDSTTKPPPPPRSLPPFSWWPSNTLSCGHPMDLPARATTTSRTGVGKTTESARQDPCTGPAGPVYLPSSELFRQQQRGIQATPAMRLSVYGHNPSLAPHVASQSRGGEPFGAFGAIDTTTAAAGTSHVPAAALDVSTVTKGEAGVRRGDQGLRRARLYGVWGAPARLLFGVNGISSASAAAASRARGVAARSPARARGVDSVTSILPAAGAVGAGGAGGSAPGGGPASIGKHGGVVGEAHSLSSKVPPATFIGRGGGIDGASHAIASSSYRWDSEASSSGGGDHPRTCLVPTVRIGADPWRIGVSGSRDCQQ